MYNSIFWLVINFFSRNSQLIYEGIFVFIMKFHSHVPGWIVWCDYV